MRLNTVLVAVALLSMLVAGGLYADKVYTPPQPPPEVVNTLHGSVILRREALAGDLVTSPDLGAIYFVNKDRRRLPFPDEQTFLSWYPDFSGVKNIPRDLLESLPLAGRNVTIRPGTHLVKVQSSPQVWAVSHPNSLMWFAQGEPQVVQVYGQSWGDRLVDTPEYFFVNYLMGPEIGAGGVVYPIGSLIHAKNDDRYFLVTGLQQRIVTDRGFEENHFQKRFAIEVDEPLSLDLVAPTLDEYEPQWGSPDPFDALEERMEIGDAQVTEGSA